MIRNFLQLIKIRLTSLNAGDTCVNDSGNSSAVSDNYPAPQGIRWDDYGNPIIDNHQ